MPEKFSNAAHNNAAHDAMPKPIALAALWRHRTAKALRHWQQYLGEQSLSNTASHEHVSNALESLTKVRYTIAVVAEVSRGKSELINAMLFAQHGKRIVPSGAGRTTMCPTEFFCDEDVAPYLELLPIETRAQSTSFAQLSNTPSAWQRFDLNGDDTEVLTLALQKMCAKQRVSLATAQALGFELDSFDNVTNVESDDFASHFNTDLTQEASNLAQHSVEIPMWRYARLNIHHPLLAKGLAILDTPGLNVLGHEPELTHAILPMVDSVMFLLGADVGVSRSDQLAWQSHLSHLPEHSKLGILNKIDALDDGFRSALEVNIDIVQQIEQTAQALALPKSQVFAISARQALLARTKHDDALLNKSRLPELERSLTTQLLEKRQSLLKKQALRALALSYQQAQQQLQAQALQTQTQLNELNELSTSREPQQMMLTYAGETKKRYAIETALSLNTKQFMDAQWLLVSDALSTASAHQTFDVLINSCQTASTSALKQQLHSTLVSLHGRMSEALLHIQKTKLAAQKTINKIEQLNQSNTNASKTKSDIKTAAPSTYQTAQLDALMDEQSQEMIQEYLNELSRIGQTSSSYFPALPFLSTSQRIKAIQTILAIQQRSELMLMDAKRYAKRWFEQINQTLNSALHLHRSMLNKRADTLERMHHAQQALTQNLNEQGVTLDVVHARIQQLEQRYQQSISAVSAETKITLHGVVKSQASVKAINEPSNFLQDAMAAKPMASANDLRHLVLTPR